MRRRKKTPEETTPGAPAWMTTYGDMVTLLLTFFVFLFTLSNIEVKKFEAAIASLQGAFGFPLMVEETPEGPETHMEDGYEINLKDDLFARDLEQLLEIERMVKTHIKEEDLETRVVVSRDERGLVIRFAENVLFDLGSADLKPEAQAILDRIGLVILEIPNEIRVEGHTDNLPINTDRFPSNWELSTGRATQVTRYFIERHGLSPWRLSAAGYGEYRPLVPNDTEADRRLNRRVDMVVLALSFSQKWE